MSIKPIAIAGLNKIVGGAAQPAPKPTQAQRVLMRKEKRAMAGRVFMINGKPYRLVNGIPTPVK